MQPRINLHINLVVENWKCAVFKWQTTPIS